jgi:hypothetical protein
MHNTVRKTTKEHTTVGSSIGSKSNAIQNGHVISFHYKRLIAAECVHDGWLFDESYRNDA